jgi:formate/nitrite transporter FocA (FNT family)
VVEVENGVIAKSRAPKSVRVLVLSVVDTVRVLGLVAVGVLRLVVGRVLRLVMGWVLRLLALLKLLAVWVLVLVVRLVPSALFASLLAHGEHLAKAVIGALLLLSAQEHKVASLWRELVQDHDRRGEGKLTSQCSGYSLQSMHSSSTKLQVGGDVGFAEGVDTEYGFS